MATQTLKYVVSAIAAAVVAQGEMSKKQQMSFKDDRTELQGNEMLQISD